MKNKIYEVSQKITWKHWAGIFFLSQLIYSIMLNHTIPQIQSEAGGMKLFDLQAFGYSSVYVNQFLSHLTSRGHDLYLYAQLPLDTLYPLLNCLTGMTTFIMLFRILCRIVGKNSQQTLPVFAIMILFLPVVAMIFDYLENAMILIMLSYEKLIPNAYIMASSSFTIIKSMSTVLFYMICLLMFVGLILAWVYKKVKRLKSFG